MKVILYTEPAWDSLNILFYEQRNGKRYVVKPINMQLDEIGEGLFAEPTLRLPSLLSNEFMQSMANEIHKKGIRPEKEPILENELVAVKYHLEDMRKLVFK